MLLEHEDGQTIEEHMMFGCPAFRDADPERAYPVAVSFAELAWAAAGLALTSAIWAPLAALSFVGSLLSKPPAYDNRRTTPSPPPVDLDE